MSRHSLALAAALALGLALPLAAQQAPIQPSPVKRTILQRTDLPGTNLEMIYATVEIAPGFKAGRHFHPGVVMAQVTEGEFWFAPDGQPDKVYKAGESLTVPDRAIHNEGATDKGVKLSAVYVLEKGKPLASPAP
ncbi:MAG: cupin domain-containing protein [Xanthobacteraceae bacterium]|nr:cupin domain-containing protein [Xanthobacteraceae bacterium]